MTNDRAQLLRDLRARAFVSAEELGILTGKKRRSIELYRAEQGMPATQRAWKTGKDGGPGKLRWEFNAGACIAWMKARGIEVIEPKDDAGAAADAPAAPGRDVFDSMPLLDVADQERKQREAQEKAREEKRRADTLLRAGELMDPARRRAWLAGQMAELESMRGVMSDDPAAADRWASVLKKVVSELRAVDEAELDLAERRGQMVERHVHERTLLDFAAAFKGACEGAESVFAQAAAEKLLNDADLLGAAREAGRELAVLLPRDTLVRLLASAARGVLDQMRSNLAAEFRRAGGEKKEGIGHWASGTGERQASGTGEEQNGAAAA